MEKLFLKHYAAIVQRGLINNQTKPHEFYIKLVEEVGEVEKCNSESLQSEIMDVTCVCMNWLTHYGIDIKKELKKNLKKQKKRTNIIKA